MPRPIDTKAQDKRRATILDAVERIVAREGLAHLTMQRVIAESGLSAGSVYHLFDGKDAILGAVVTRQDAGTGELIAALERGFSVRFVLRHSARAMLDYLTDPMTARLNIELANGARGDVPWGVQLRENDAALKAALMAAIRRDRGKGRLSRKVEPETATRMIIALWEGVVSQAAQAPFADRRALGRSYIGAIYGVLRK
jgi:AcrR family transcriptional regulator